MTRYDEAFKLSIVQSYAAGQCGFKGVARRYGFDAATVRRWVKGYEQHGEDGLRKKFSHYSAAVQIIRIAAHVAGGTLDLPGSGAI